MAKIGLNNLWYSKLTEAQDGTPSYDGAKSFGKAVSCNVSISNNSATLYADDALAESDTSFQNGTVTLGVDDDRDATFADVLGHEVDDSGKVTRNVNDVAPYVALGRIIVKMVSNVRLYKVEILYKVKFSEPSQEENTKGESVEFSTPSIEGQVAALANGDWSDSKTFATKAEALAYIMGVFAPAGVRSLAVGLLALQLALRSTTRELLIIPLRTLLFTQFGPTRLNVYLIFAITPPCSYTGGRRYF